MVDAVLDDYRTAPISDRDKALFAFIDKMMRARDVEEVVRLQTEFAQAQAKRLAEQTRTLGEAAAQAVSEAKRG